jgi:hypothetical protein
MSTAMFVATIVLFIGLLVVTVWGWQIVPAQGRFPISFGVPPSVDGTIGKRAGLILFLLIGLWFTLLSLFAAFEDAQIGWIGVGLLAFFLAMEHRLIRRLGR